MIMNASILPLWAESLPLIDLKEAYKLMKSRTIPVAGLQPLKAELKRQRRWEEIRKTVNELDTF